jgi:hypothetical protein
MSFTARLVLQRYGARFPADTHRHKIWLLFGHRRERSAGGIRNDRACMDWTLISSSASHLRAGFKSSSTELHWK